MLTKEQLLEVASSGSTGSAINSQYTGRLTETSARTVATWSDAIFLHCVYYS